MSTVLYIDDNTINIQLVGHMLRKANLKMVHAIDGQEGLEMANQIEPDIIIVDYHMPGLSGVDVANRLKANPKLMHIPLIALTADSLPETYRACKEAGFSAYLNKPISKTLLINTITKLLENKTAVPSYDHLDY